MTAKSKASGVNNRDNNANSTNATIKKNPMRNYINFTMKSSMKLKKLICVMSA